LLNAIENALARDADNLRHEVKVLNAEVASLKATLAELRLTVADKRKAKVESFELPVEPASRHRACERTTSERPLPFSALSATASLATASERWTVRSCVTRK
jgi:hypothetical protein